MIFAPARLGSVTLDNETLAADKKGCRRFGPCGVGEKALYLNSFFIDRHYYVALESVRRVFKRVAMSKGGFTGKGAFGSIPYLVVEYDDGAQKQCNFKHEEDVDNLLAYLAKICPDLPLQSQKVERHMAQQQAQEARRYLKELTPQAQSEKERLEQARAFLEDHTNLTRRLSQAAKAKRVNDRSNPSYKWVALAIVIAGVAALVYGIITMVRGTSSLGIYFALFGFAAVFLFSGAHVLPTARNNKTALSREWEQAQADLAAVRASGADMLLVGASGIGGAENIALAEQELGLPILLPDQLALLYALVCIGCYQPAPELGCVFQQPSYDNREMR